MSEQKMKGVPIPVGIVGCGGVAQVIHLPILHRHPDVQVQAVCDADTSKAAFVAEKFGVPRMYQDIEDMFQHEELELVYILTPNNLHLPMSLFALERGVHLFVEKPAARTAAEAERLRKKALEANRTVMVGMQNRFRADVQAIKKFVSGSELGNLFFIKAGWLQAKHQAMKQPWIFQKGISGGGVVLDLGVQLLDLVWWLLDKPKPLSIKATSFKSKNNIEVEDFCIICVMFDNGVAFSLEVSWDFPIPEDRMYLEIAGETGTCTLSPLRLQKMLYGQIVNITPEIKESRAAHFRKSYENEVNHNLSFLTGRVSAPESTINDSVQVLKMVDAIYESIETGREVVFS